MSDSPEIVDSHCHLDFPDFDAERAEIVERAVAAGVRRMVTICTRLRQAPEVRAIAEAHDPVFWAAGTHPMSAADEPLATVDELIALSQHPKFVGIGESGLDYHYTADSAEVQQQSLRIHIAAARETGLPLIIHARDADEDMARILTEEYRAGAYTCVMHCFSSSAALRAPRSTSASTCRCRASPPSPKATICAPSSPPRRSTVSSWKPTAPISPPRPIAASATNRPIPCTPRASAPRSSA
jgi:TatD family hydrolase